MAEGQARLLGGHLLTGVVHQCYPLVEKHEGAVTIEFEHERDAARVNAALAFGAVTAAVLAPGRRDSGSPAPARGLLCAIFNLGIGLVDGLSDEDPGTGGLLLRLLNQDDLIEAAAQPKPRGWLLAKLSPRLAADLGVAFTAEIIEAFFRSLHEVYPGELWLQLRQRVGAQLAIALEAELQSVGSSPLETSREQLIECSRRTSVLPFQIIQTLAVGESSDCEPSAGTLLGEAAWRIDDLVDLCLDARRGALNGLLVAATEKSGHPDGELAGLAALECLLHSTEIQTAAVQAAEDLLAGLRLAGSGHAAAEDGALFLQFIQKYAGISADWGSIERGG